MIRTLNRQPMSVNVPKKNDISQHFFNTYNWKGLIDDKNFAAVDQESFEDCENVYVTSDGLLKSRPSLKKQSIVINGVTNHLSYITDVWRFGNVIVYRSEDDYLTFVQNDTGHQIELEFVTGDTTKRIKLVVADQKIFVFTNAMFKYYDIDTPGIYDAKKFVYIPTTSVYINGLAQTDVETKNIMTNAEIKRYVYDSVTQYNFNEFVGKNYKVKIDNNEYEITYQNDSNLTFVDKYTKLNENNFIKDNFIFGRRNAIGYPLIKSASNGVVLISNYSVIIDTINNVPVISWTIRYTLNGLVFYDLPLVENIIGVPMLTEDGNHVVVFKDEGPYIKSIIATEEDGENKLYKYENWTNLLMALDPTTYANWISNSFHLNVIPAGGTTYDRISNQVNGYFKTDRTFAFVYGDDCLLDAHGSDYNYYKLYCVYNYENNQNNELRKQDLFSNSSDFYYEPAQFTPCSGDAVPNLKCHMNENNLSIIIDTLINIKNSQGYHRGFSKTIFHIEYDGNSQVFEKVYSSPSSLLGDNGYAGYVFDYLVLPIKNDCKTDGSTLAFIVTENTTPVSPTKLRYLLNTCKLKNDRTIDTIETLQLYESDTIETSQKYYSEINKTYFRFAISSNHLLTNKFLFISPTYLTKINLLYVEGENTEYKPIELFYNYNTVNNIYLATSNYLYTFANKFELIETVLTSGSSTADDDVNYIVPEYEAETDNYFISTDKQLMISDYRYDEDKNFLWYFPKINVEEFDYKITNLHAISSSEIAIFTDNAIYYASYDNNINAYRYYMSKVQVGLKDGGDVITSFDGKYTIFGSSRGLVALSYQDFIASTEQSLNYLSDNIYDNFHNYFINTDGKIKLYKFGYWILCYSNSLNYGFVLDGRNMSWWPVRCSKIPTKFVDIDNEVKLLSEGIMLNLDKSDINYFDDFDEMSGTGDKITHKIFWNILSQKLYLSALNYYKHIVNMTFISVHDLSNLTENDYNIDELDFRLEVYNYRKKVDSNISFNDTYPIVTYDVNIARTFVQRLNFGKVNEFQYRLSFDDEIDALVQIPLSLNGITVKYKMGDMVR